MSLYVPLRKTTHTCDSVLNNVIAGAIGSERPDLVRAHISTALALLSGIAVILGLMVAAAVAQDPWIDWNGLFNVKSLLARGQVGARL